MPAVQELSDCEDDGSQGKRLPNLCGRVAAAQHARQLLPPAPASRASPGPLDGGVIRSHVPPPALGISSDLLLFLKNSGAESWERWE